MFTTFNKSLSFDDDFLAMYKLDGYLQLPLSNEQIEIPQELINSLWKNLKNFKGLDKTDKGPIKELVELLAKH